MKRNTALRIALGGAAAGAVMMLPGIAGADVKSYNGDDYSQDFHSGHEIRSCDQESDSEQVHADAQFTNGESKGVISRDANGNEGTCGESGHYDRIIRRHRTCEERDFAPDECGNWVGTGY